MAVLARSFGAVAGVAALCATGLGASIRRGPLDTPDMRPYDPVEVLCTRGTEVQGWCATWVGCIESGAQPAGDAAAVKAAWGPADCKEVCGVWPMTSPTSAELVQLRGLATAAAAKANVSAATAAAAKLFGLTNRTSTRRDCETSCENFQESLSSCVASVVFEPGRVAAMGMPDPNAAPPPEHCTEKDTPCMPDLPIKHQKCLAHKTKAVLDKEYEAPEDVKSNCAQLASYMEDCKACPQLAEGYSGHYYSFVGGCMAQLHTYYAATDPSGGSAAINMGETGCKPH